VLIKVEFKQNDYVKIKTGQNRNGHTKNEIFENIDAVRAYTVRRSHRINGGRSSN